MSKTLLSVYQRLYTHFGDPHWWPARSPYEVMTGAVLTQNTAWGNVEKAIAGFDGLLSPQLVEKISLDELKEIIRPAGFAARKAACLKALTAWYKRYDYDVVTVQRESPARLRAELLEIRGIGPETADAILLYAFGRLTFVVDAYTNRLCACYPIDAGKSYHEVKAFFEMHLPEDIELYNRFHALIVINGKEHCRKKPLCAACPLSGDCKKNTI